MSRNQIQISVKNGESQNEKENIVARTNLTNAITSVIVLGIIGLVIYFLAPILWNSIKFVALLINLVFASFYGYLYLAFKRKANLESVNKGLTNRDLVHERQKAKPVTECSEEEKAKAVENDKVIIGFMNLSTMSLWLMPLLFGASEKFQDVPLNYFAPVVTLIGFIAWIRLVANNSKLASNLDEKVSKVSFWGTLFTKLTGLTLSLYIGMVLLVIITSYYGITLPAIPSLPQ